MGNQQFTFGVGVGGGRPISTPIPPPVDGTIEDSNNAAGVDCDAGTCASSGENEPFDLRYVVDTMFDGLTYRQQHTACRNASEARLRAEPNGSTPAWRQLPSAGSSPLS
jgi:hypothetical protein